MLSPLRIQLTLRGPAAVHDRLLGRDGGWIRRELMRDGDASYVMRRVMADRDGDDWAHLLRLLVASGAVDESHAVSGISAERLLRVVGLPLRVVEPAPVVYQVDILGQMNGVAAPGPSGPDGPEGPDGRDGGLFSESWGSFAVGVGGKDEPKKGEGAKPGGCRKVEVVKVEGDGNCFYRAALQSAKAEGIDLEAGGYMELRRQMAIYVKENYNTVFTPDFRVALGAIHNMDVNAIVTRISKDKEWTDNEVEPIVLGLMLRNDRNLVNIIFDRQTKPEQGYVRGRINLFFTGPPGKELNHYNAVVCKDDPGGKDRPKKEAAKKEDGKGGKKEDGNANPGAGAKTEAKTITGKKKEKAGAKTEAKTGEGGGRGRGGGEAGAGAGPGGRTVPAAPLRLRGRVRGRGGGEAGGGAPPPAPQEYPLPASPDAEVNPLTGEPFSADWADAERARRERMPFLKDKEMARIRAALDRSRVVVISGDVGAGKTTQVPKILLGWLRARDPAARIVVTSPRAAPAIELAGQLARELEVSVGKEVGYSTRHDKRNSPSAALTMVTEGTLVQQALRPGADPALGYAAWVLDEVHERTVDVDLLMLQGLDLANDPRLPDFRTIVMSATADTDRFVRYFRDGGVPVEHVHVANRTHPITRHFLPPGTPPPRDYVAACVDRALEICARPVPKDRRDRDDVLVFLATKSDLEKAEAQFERRAKADPAVRGRAKGYVLSADTDREDLGLHTGAACREGAPPEAGCASSLGVERKVIFSTNVAETSLTFATLRYVVDSARALVAGFDSEAGVSVLENKLVTRANARQRAGRVGRTAPGDAYVLVSEADFEAMDEFAPPEVETTELTATFLRLLVADADGDDAGKERGLETLAADRLRRMIQVPDGATLTHAIRRLTRFGAVGPKTPYPLTDLGRAIAELSIVGVDMAYALLAAPDYECEREVAAVAALASQFSSVDQAFVQPEDRRRVPFPEGARKARHDLDLLLRVYRELTDRLDEGGRWGMMRWGMENAVYMRKFSRVVIDEVPDLLKRAEEARLLARPEPRPTKTKLPTDPTARVVQCLADCLPEQRLVLRGGTRVLAGSGASVTPRLSRTFTGLARALGSPSAGPLLYLNLTRDQGRRVASLLAPLP